MTIVLQVRAWLRPVGISEIERAGQVRRSDPLNERNAEPRATRACWSGRHRPCQPGRVVRRRRSGDRTRPPRRCPSGRGCGRRAGRSPSWRPRSGLPRRSGRGSAAHQDRARTSMRSSWSRTRVRFSIRKRQITGVRGSFGARRSILESRWVGWRTTKPWGGPELDQRAVAIHRQAESVREDDDRKIASRRRRGQPHLQILPSPRCGQHDRADLDDRRRATIYLSQWHAAVAFPLVMRASVPRHARPLGGSCGPSSLR
jgi:hypothetical protein